MTADVSGRPETGPGSVAGVGVRIRAFIVDSLLSIAVALLAAETTLGRRAIYERALAIRKGAGR